MPLFSTLIVACVATVGGGMQCEGRTFDNFQDFDESSCYRAMDKKRYNLVSKLKKQDHVVRFVAGTHNCFRTKATRDSVLERTQRMYAEGGLTLNIEEGI